MFTQSVVERLDYYVYFLQDPRTNRVFYIGKGIGNRIYDHLNCAVETEVLSVKLDTIREIRSAGKEVIHYVVRHGLSEEAAFEVEAALIDFVGIEGLSNIQGGHHSGDFGIKRAEEISAMYDAEPFSTNESVLLINLNRLFNRRMSPNELYEATRKAWVIGPRRENARYAIATYRGLTREVYKINFWFPINEETKPSRRWGFDGELAEPKIREELSYKSIQGLFERGAANPIRYINC